MKEFWNNLVKVFTDQGISEGLAKAYLITIAIIAVMAVVALVMKIYVIVKYSQGNKTKTTSGKTSFEVAREALDKMGLREVKVARAGFFRTLFFGNSYSLSKRTVFLRKNISDKDSITAVCMAIQKVGVAKLCEGGNKTAKTRNVFQVLSIFCPNLFVPSVLVGMIADFCVFSKFGTFSFVGIAIGLAFVLTGFVATILSLPVEKKANDIALQIIEETGVLTKEEQAVAKQIYNAYIVYYVCEFIIAVLRIIQLILELIMNIQKANNKK